MSNFIHVFEGKESNGDKHTELASMADLEKPRSTSGKRGIWGHTDDWVLVTIIIFHLFI